MLFRSPNKAIRKDKGGLFLYDKAIYLDRGQNCWRYKANDEEVSDKEFWIPQKPTAVYTPPYEQNPS